MIGDSRMVPTTGTSLEYDEDNVCGSNATPDVMFVVVVVRWPDVPAVVTFKVTGVKLNLLSLSLPSLATSGVGMRGRFFSGTVDRTAPLRPAFESYT